MSETVPTRVMTDLRRPGVLILLIGGQYREVPEPPLFWPAHGRVTVDGVEYVDERKARKP